MVELDLDGSHGRRVDGFLEAHEIERAVAGTAPEVAGADLPDQISPVEMVGGHSPLAGVVQAAGKGGAAVQSFDCSAGQRSEAHRRDVDDRCRPELLLSAPRLSKDLGTRNWVVGIMAWISRVRTDDRKGGVLDDQIIRRCLEVVIGAKAEVVVLLLRGGIDPAALVAGEGALFVVPGDDVLP
jgi:hypothetical protein